MWQEAGTCSLLSFVFRFLSVKLSLFCSLCLNFVVTLQAQRICDEDTGYTETIRYAAAGRSDTEDTGRRVGEDGFPAGTRGIGCPGVLCIDS